MPKSGYVELHLTKQQCAAAAWWLRNHFIPYAVRRWRMRPFMTLPRNARGIEQANVLTGQWTRDLVAAALLAKQFGKAGKRKIKGRDTDPAVREVKRELAFWFGSLHTMSKLGLAPPIIPGVEYEFPDAAVLASLPAEASQTMLLGLGTQEAMVACWKVARSPTTGRRQERRTLAIIKGRSFNDDRNQRKAIARAKREEEWDSRMRRLSSCWGGLEIVL